MKLRLKQDGNDDWYVEEERLYNGAHFNRKYWAVIYGPAARSVCERHAARLKNQNTVKQIVEID